MRFNEIVVPHGAMTKLSKDTGFSLVAVRHALRGFTNSENSRMIRERAKKFYGGVELKQGVRQSSMR